MRHSFGYFAIACRCQATRMSAVMADITPITRERIAATEKTIRPYIRRTPLLRVDPGDFGLSLDKLSFKLEMLQHSGSFKARGAFEIGRASCRERGQRSGHD